MARAKAKSKLSTRQKTSRKINRRRQWRKWWQVSQRFFAISTLLCVLGACAGGWWFWHSGRLSQMVDTTRNRFWAATAHAGFKVDHVYLEGRKFTTLSEIHQAMGVRSGDPILALSLPSMRARLEAIPRVQSAEIARVLPDRLYVNIAERQPIAVWQNEGKLHLIDDNGIVMEYVEPMQYGQLLLVVGEDAPSHAHALLMALAEAPVLYKDVVSASRVGKRRWDVRFRNGAVLKLPEQNPGEAWRNFARLEQEQHVLERAIKSVDMRLADRVFIKLAPPADPKQGKQDGDAT